MAFVTWYWGQIVNEIKKELYNAAILGKLEVAKRGWGKLDS